MYWILWKLGFYRRWRFTKPGRSWLTIYLHTGASEEQVSLVWKQAHLFMGDGWTMTEPHRAWRAQPSE